ncbi:MAG: hypothetical protein JKY56_11270 [Kofleriaceae bacterium]|nr:hypothetical protein [Kofleriaceae bacterium]
MLILLLSIGLTGSCGHSDEGGGPDEGEVITRVELSFTPEAGGTPILALFDDPDGDGGDAPTIDDIQLAAGNYTLALRFENGLETPAEDITIEISDESAEHQVFLTGSAVDGPATDNAGAPLQHSYDDMDANGLPIGLVNSIVAVTGSGQLIITLRHLPPIGDRMVKSSELNGDVALSGFSAIGGATDVQVQFSVTVP